MIATRTDVEICFQDGPLVNGGASGTLQGRWDRDFTSQHEFLLPGNHRDLRASERKTTLQLSQVPHPRLDEKVVIVIIKLGRRTERRGLEPFNYKKEQDLPEEGESKVWREEGRMWVFIRPRGGQELLSAHRQD